MLQKCIPKLLLHIDVVVNVFFNTFFRVVELKKYKDICSTIYKGTLYIFRALGGLYSTVYDKLNDKGTKKNLAMEKC